jgi:hypothetical protein
MCCWTSILTPACSPGLDFTTCYGPCGGDARGACSFNSTLGAPVCICSNATGSHYNSSTSCVSCEIGWGGPTCSDCAHGFYGPNCQACSPTVCSGVNHGRCNDTINGNGKCICDGNYMGASCNECKPGFFGPSCAPCPTCYNGGTCNQVRASTACVFAFACTVSFVSKAVFFHLLFTFALVVYLLVF